MNAYRDLALAVAQQNEPGCRYCKTNPLGTCGFHAGRRYESRKEAARVIRPGGKP